MHNGFKDDKNFKVKRKSEKYVVRVIIKFLEKKEKKYFKNKITIMVECSFDNKI